MSIAQLNLIDSVRRGPSFVESEFRKLTLEKGQPSPRPDDLVEIAKTAGLVKKEAFLRPFIVGFFYSLSGFGSDNDLEKEKFLNNALQSYERFLHNPEGALPDWLYYAQWQLAEIRGLLGRPWNTVEEQCLKAAEWDPMRAEALRHILLYRFQREQWRIAHIYSSFCTNQFQGKCPTQRSWFINPAFYNWKILKYHIPILLAIRKKDEAAIKLAELLDILKANPEKFSEKDHLDIENLKNMI